MPTDRFADLKPRPLPPVPPLWACLGPGIVWMALAQGSSELYYWPYFTAKYGALYLCLLVPACVLQMPLNIEIARYTMLTGESVFTGFTRLGRGFGLFMWLFFAVNFLFVGAFATMGATALADIAPWPAGWTDQQRSLLWSYALTAVFAAALLVGRVVYRLIERFMLAVALFTAAGLVAACLQPDVLRAAPDFLRALVLPESVPPVPADPGELKKFLTLLCYSGLGGFWSLFYSFWIREKGFGMAGHVGHITSPLTGKKELIAFEGYRFEDTPENEKRWRGWTRALLVDNASGVLGNLATTLLMALLAFALLHPKGIVPTADWKAVVAQGEFFRAAWGPAGRAVFLIVAACFLMDTWLAGVDAVSRVHAEMTCTYIPAARKRGVRFWYYVFLLAMTVNTWIMLPIGDPVTVVTWTGVMSVFAVVVFSLALWVLNHVHLPRRFPPWTRPRPPQKVLFAGVILFYLAASVYYLWVQT